MLGSKFNDKKFNDTLSVLDKHARKKNEIYTFQQLQFYDRRTEESSYEQIKTKKYVF